MSFSRRDFCAFLGTAGLASLVNTTRGDQPDSSGPRVIAYNVYVFDGWPKDRPLAIQAKNLGQMPARVAQELALYRPDIINFSESPSQRQAEEVAKQLGMHHVRFPSGKNWPGTILSRYEIVESANAPIVGGNRPEDLFTRHWGRATLKLSEEENLVVHSAHLMPGPDPAVRLRETAEMLRSMAQDMEANRSMLVIGDLNHTPDTKEYQMWIDAGWIDTFTAAGTGEGPTIPANLPTRRIDYILARGPIAKRIVESRPLFEGAFRLNDQDPHGFALSDHLPQFAVFGEKE